MTEELKRTTDLATAKAREMESEAYRFALGKANGFLAEGKADKVLAELGQTARESRGWEYGYLLRAAASKTPQEICTMSRHEEVNQVLYTPDGRRVMTAGKEGKIVFWAADGREALAEWVCPKGVNAAAFSPDGKRLFAAGKDKPVRIFDVESGKEVGALTGLGDWVCSLAVSPDGALVAAGGGDGCIAVWTTGDGQLVKTWPGRPLENYRAYSIAFSTNGEIMALSHGPTLEFYDTRTWDCKRRTQKQTKAVSKILFTPDGKLMATASGDTTIMLWPTDGEEPIATLEGHTAGIEDMAISHDGRRLFSCGYDGTIRVWDVGSRILTSTMKAHARPIRRLDVSPDGLRLVSGDDSGNTKLWRVPSGEATAVLKVSRIPIMSAAFHPSGTHLVSVSHQKPTLSVWNAIDGKQLPSPQVEEPMAMSVAFAPKGDEFVMALNSGRIKGLTCGAGFFKWPECSRIATCPLDVEQLQAIAWSPDGRLVAATDLHAQLFVIDSGSHALLRKIGNPKGGVFGCLAFSPDGKTVAVGAEGPKEIVFWNVETGQKTRSLAAPEVVKSLAISQDGRWLAAGTGRPSNQILVWNLEVGGEPRKMEGYEDQVSGVCFHPSSQRLASAGWDKTARIWDVATGRELLVLRGHSERLRSITFSRDGRTLATTGSDGTAILWYSEPWGLDGQSGPQDQDRF